MHYRSFQIRNAPVKALAGWDTTPSVVVLIAGLLLIGSRLAAPHAEHEVDRQRGNLARRVAAIDDEVAAMLMAQMAALGKQSPAVVAERDKLAAERILEVSTASAG